MNNVVIIGNGVAGITAARYIRKGSDARAYAQRGADIVRASCVGCGICSSVCPRGVLNLENGPIDTRNT